MKGDWGRYFEMRLADRPGHEVKLLLLMAAMKVDLRGLKTAACKYLASLHLVMSRHRMIFAWFG